MPRVLVTDDNGMPVWTERVTAADFESEHFRGCLRERLSWAVADAQMVPDDLRHPRIGRSTRKAAPAPAA
jgi:hypothetical protein